MFVEHSVTVPRPVEDVCKVLASGSVALLGESLAHVGDEVARWRARVGPGSSYGGLAKTVELTFGPVRKHADATLIAFSWHATGPLPLFPDLDADLELCPVDLSRTKVTLRGRYQPPGGALGEGIDRVILHRLADATLRAFLTDLARRLAPDPADGSVPGPRPAPWRQR